MLRQNSLRSKPGAWVVWLLLVSGVGVAQTADAQSFNCLIVSCSYSEPGVTCVDLPTVKGHKFFTYNTEKYGPCAGAPNAIPLCKSRLKCKKGGTKKSPVSAFIVASVVDSGFPPVTPGAAMGSAPEPDDVVEEGKCEVSVESLENVIPEGTPNDWKPNTGKFPAGGFKYLWTAVDPADGVEYIYQAHGHGPNPAAIKFGGNSGSNPTVTLSRFFDDNSGSKKLAKQNISCDGGSPGGSPSWKQPSSGLQNSMHPVLSD